ncbi:hypothetical protein Tco_0502972 [Tanacetum coccineum]
MNTLGDLFSKYSSYIGPNKLSKSSFDGIDANSADESKNTSIGAMRDLDVENKQKKNLKASYGVITLQELRIMKIEKDIENMSIAEYMEYEARMKRQNVHPTRCEDADFNYICSKSVAMEYLYYSENSKIDFY